MRIKYYDWLEAVAIFLVCSVHAVWLKGNVAASISMSLVPMAVPIFFMVHGALLLTKEASPKKQLKRFLKVAGQVIGWNTVYLLVSIATGLVDPSTLTLGFFYNYYIVFLDSTGVTSGHLWFIYALLAVYAFFPILDACKQRSEKMLKYVWIICFIKSFVRYEVLVYGTYFGQKFFGENKVFDIEEFIRNLSPMGEYANCILYFITGYFLSQWVQRNPQVKEQRGKYMVLAGIGFAAGLGLLMLERYIDFGQFKYNWKPLPHQYERIGALVMASCVFVIFSLIDFKDGKLYRIARTLSLHTLDIYYIHIIYARYFRLYLYEHHLAGVFQNYLRALVILILSFLTGQVLRRIPLVKKLLT